MSKTAVLMVLVTCLIGTSANAINAPPAGETACQIMNRLYKDQPALATAASKNWLEGFYSGLNSHFDTRGPEYDTYVPLVEIELSAIVDLERSIKAFCATRPNETFSSLIWKTWRDLHRPNN